MRTNLNHLTLLLCLAGAVGACTEEPKPRSVLEFVENPIMLEAAVVRCARDRAQSRYDQECINARQALSQMEAKEEARRRADLEARSESKRRALRRAQEAASQARTRAAEAERLRQEAEYLAQFGVAPGGAGDAADASGDFGNSPQVVISGDGVSVEESTGNREVVVPPTDGGNAPVIATEPDEAPTDLESIRDELQRRKEENGD